MKTTGSSPQQNTAAPGDGSSTILVADDHAVVRDGLSLILESIPGATIVGEARNGAEAITQFRALRPDLLTLDLRMPEVDGLEVVRTLVSEFPSAKILIVTTYDTDEDIHNALQSGARGYVLKDSHRSLVTEAATTVLKGGHFTPPKVAEKLMRRLSAPSLTPREIEVLQRVAAGRINKEIADDLGIGTGTVKSHLANVLTKLDAHSRTEAVTVARERGYIPV